MIKYASLRSRLLDYAKSQAPRWGVHESRLGDIVDKVLAQHPSDEKRPDMMLLKRCVVEQLMAEEVTYDILIRIDLTDGWGDAEFTRVVRALEDRDFTSVTTARYFGVAEFAARSSHAPDEARSQAVAAVETVTKENPGWTIRRNEVLAEPAELGTEPFHRL